jgi:hypothetical protein
VGKIVGMTTETEGNQTDQRPQTQKEIIAEDMRRALDKVEKDRLVRLAEETEKGKIGEMSRALDQAEKQRRARILAENEQADREAVKLDDDNFDALVKKETPQGKGYGAEGIPRKSPVKIKY